MTEELNTLINTVTECLDNHDIKNDTSAPSTPIKNGKYEVYNHMTENAIRRFVNNIFRFKPDKLNK